MPMPELGPLSVGDEVVVITEPQFAGRRARRAVVAKAAPVWIDLKEVDGEGVYPRTWRMRRDTQDDAAEIGFPEVFRTPEQWKWEQRDIEAAEYLQEQGVELAYRSPWIGRRAELADALRALGGPAAP